MSIYDSEDKIEMILKTGSIIGSDFFKKKPFLTTLAKDKLTLLKTKLTDLDKLDESHETRIDGINEILSEIEEFLSTDDARQSKIQAALRWVSADLLSMRKGYERLQRLQRPQTTPTPNPLPPHLEKLKKEYQKIQTYRISLVPGKAELGLSEGICYAMTHSMVDSELSPYLKDNVERVKHTRKLHDYQENQYDRTKDQNSIKSTRITLKRFCPDLKTQAEQLFKIAQKNESQHLGIDLVGNGRAHRIYLKIQGGKIQFMEPSCGAYVFDTKEEFFAAFQIIFQIPRSTSNDAHLFYQVSRLIEDKEGKQQESITSAGKWRSFLTGGKYSTGIDRGTRFINVLSSAGIGLLAGALIGSAVPIIGTIIGGLVGAVIGLLVSSGFIAAANRYQHNGLLGFYHTIREGLYWFKEKIKRGLGLSNHGIVHMPERVLPTTSSEQLDSSTQQILSRAPPRSTTTQEPSPNAPSPERQTPESVPEPDSTQEAAPSAIGPK